MAAHLLDLWQLERIATAKIIAQISPRWYMKLAGGYCPACGSDEEIEALGGVHIDGPYGHQKCSCVVCGAVWYDEWQLTGYAELVRPKD